MNVSAASDTWSLYNYAAKAKQNSTTDTSNDTSATTAAQQAATNTSKNYSGLDNAAAQAFFASVMSQGVLPTSSTNSNSDSSSTSTTAVSSSDSTSSSTTGSATLSLFDFLTKVKNGTVTDADLTSIQSFLTQGTSQNDSSTTSKSASDSTTAATTAADSSTSSSTLSLKDFLQKIKEGTVTDSDLSTMKSKLASLQGEFSAGLMSPSPTEQSSAVNDTTADRTQSVQSTSNFSEQLLYNVSEAYLQNSYISNQNNSLFSTKS